MVVEVQRDGGDHPGGAPPAGDGPARQTPFGGWSADRAQEVGDEIASLAGQIAAATARFLQLVGEFDARDGWRAYRGVQSAVHWLSWRTGMDLRTAREQLRVARALRDLPSTSAAFSQGTLSYSKVRALTRVATAETEKGLVDIATHAPAAHVERLTRGILTAAHRSGGEAEEVLPAEQQGHQPHAAPGELALGRRVR